MPKLTDHAGATLFVFPNDHPPPHIHVRYQGNSVRLRIVDAESMDPRRDFPYRVLRDAQDWLLANQDKAIKQCDTYHS